MKKKNAWIILLAVMIIVIMILSFMDLIDSKFGMSLALELFIFFDIIVVLVARKNNVKAVEWVMIVLAIIGGILFILNLVFRSKISKEEFKFQVVATPNTSEKTLRFNYGGFNYYTYNLSDISVVMTENEEKIGLQAALINNKVTLEEVLALAAPNNGTVGYTIYYDGGTGKYENDKYSIVVCENETKDIIFSTYTYEYNETICE